MKLKFKLIALLSILAVAVSCRDEDRPNVDIDEPNTPEQVVEATPIFEGDTNGNILTFDLDVSVDEDDLRMMAYYEGSYEGKPKLRRNNKSFFKLDAVDWDNPHGQEGTNAVHCVLRRVGKNPVSIYKTIKWHGAEVSDTRVRLHLRSVRIALPDGVEVKKGEEWYILGMIGGMFDPSTGHLLLDGKGYRFQSYLHNVSQVGGNERRDYQDMLDVPHMTAWTKLNIHEDHFGKGHVTFKPRGVLMRHHFSSRTLGNINIRQATITSDAYTNAGYFHPAGQSDEQVRANSYPIWVTNQEQVNDTYIFRDEQGDFLVDQDESSFGYHGIKKMGVSFARLAPQNFMLVWGMPVDAPNRTIKVVSQLRESRYSTLTMADRLTYYRKGMAPLQEGRSYRMHSEITNDLVISRVYYEQSAKGAEAAPDHSYNYSIIQLENTNYDAIDLSRYAIVRFDGKDDALGGKGAFVPYAMGEVLQPGEFLKAQVIPLGAILGRNPFTGLWAGWPGKRGDYSGNWYRRIYGMPSLVLEGAKTLLIGAGGYVKSGQNPDANTRRYLAAMEAGNVPLEDFTNLEHNLTLGRRTALLKKLRGVNGMEDQAYPRAGTSADSSIIFGYCQSMVAIDDGIVKDAMYTEPTSGVLQAGKMIGYALIKALDDGTFVVVDTSVPIGYNDRLTYKAYKALHDISYSEYRQFRENVQTMVGVTEADANLPEEQDWRVLYRWQAAKFSSPKFSDLTNIRTPHSVRSGWTWNSSSQTEAAGDRLGLTFNHSLQRYRTFSPFAPNYMGYNLNHLDDPATYVTQGGVPPIFGWEVNGGTSEFPKIPHFSKRLGHNFGPNWTRVKPAVDPALNLNPLF